jgi:thymidylate kinase
MTDQEANSRMVRAVFAAWTLAGVDWLVLRNYESLPESTTNDIDVLVAPDDLDRAEKIMREQARASRFALHNRAAFATLAFYFSHQETGATVHFDLFTALKWRSLDFLRSDRFLTRKRNLGLFCVPHIAHEAATSLLATMIYTGQVKDKYKPAIQAGLAAEPAEATTLLAETYGENLARFVAEAGTAGQWRRIEVATPALRRALVLRQICTHPIRTFGSVLTDGRRVISRWIRPPGLSVVLCGADGSGKSTVETMLADALRATFPEAKGRRFHWKPPVFSGRRQSERPPVVDPHAKPARGSIPSAAFFAVHWIEFFLGSHLRIRPVTFRGGLVIIDRYYYDFLVDQGRYRLDVPEWLVRFGLAFVRKPDLVLLLDAPVDVLRARKREVTPEETRRQRESYLSMIRTLPNGHIINAARSLDMVVADIRKLIFDFMVRRQAGRE